MPTSRALRFVPLVGLAIGVGSCDLFNPPTSYECRAAPALDVVTPEFVAATMPGFFLAILDGLEVTSPLYFEPEMQERIEIDGYEQSDGTMYEYVSVKVKRWEEHTIPLDSLRSIPLNAPVQLKSVRYRYFGYAPSLSPTGDSKVELIKRSDGEIKGRLTVCLYGGLSETEKGSFSRAFAFAVADSTIR